MAEWSKAIVLWMMGERQNIVLLNNLMHSCLALKLHNWIGLDNLGKESKTKTNRVQTKEMKQKKKTASKAYPLVLKKTYQKKQIKISVVGEESIFVPIRSAHLWHLMQWTEVLESLIWNSLHMNMLLVLSSHTKTSENLTPINNTSY